MTIDATSAPPVLSTPAENLFQDAASTPLRSGEARLSEDELYMQYEIPRTIQEIREKRYRRIALQFPDEMLSDAPRVFERLRDGLRMDRSNTLLSSNLEVSEEDGVNAATDSLKAVQIQSQNHSDLDVEVKLCILADTSYGACCVDEVAAEHVDADVVVHYGRTCLSPTARLPVIYVFTTKSLDLQAVVVSFTERYPNKEEKVCLMADIPYQRHLPGFHNRLREFGYTHIFATEIIHDPASLLPNRTIPPEAKDDPAALKEYSVFHISSPPAPLILSLASRVKALQIFPTTLNTTSANNSSTYQPTTTALLRRRYALLSQLNAAPVIGILINTLSVSNYMAALSHCRTLIAAAGKKAYTFVVGKVNVAKLANFSEVAAWVVISCWESSLLEGLEKDFLAPVVTPFELEVALAGQAGRVYGGEWNLGDFSALPSTDSERVEKAAERIEGVSSDHRQAVTSGNWDDQISDDEEPAFDLRTGRYVSRARPMGRAVAAPTPSTNTTGNTAPSAPPSSDLVQRAKCDVVAINGTHSPGAEFLRSKRTWQGLGSDYEIAYERDADGKIRGAVMEEGRSGVAKGYSAGEPDAKS